MLTAILVDIDSDGNVRGEYNVGQATSVDGCVRILARYCATHGVVLGLSGEVVFDLAQVA